MLEACCEGSKEKDAEIANLKYLMKPAFDERDYFYSKNQQLNAKVAMMSEFLTEFCLDTSGCMVNGNILSEKAKEALTATEADVTKWLEDRDKKVLESAINRLGEYDSDELFVETAIDIIRGE
jgi:hypothetical protein